MSIDDFASRFNPLVVAILRTPVLHWLLSPGLMLITVTGRRSGRRYTIPVGYQRDGDRLFVLVSEARKKTWWRNFQEAQAAEITLRGRRIACRAVAVEPRSEMFAERIEASLRRMPGMARVFGVTGYDRGTGLTAAQHETLANEGAIVRVDLGVDPGRD